MICYPSTLAVNIFTFRYGSASKCILSLVNSVLWDPCASAKVLKGLVKRGRKSKRGRKPKVEVKGKAAVFPQKAKERITYSKKDKKEIKKIMREQKADAAADSGKSTAGGKRDASGKLKSKHIPPSRAEMGDEGFARRVIQGLIGKTKAGEVKDIGNYAEIPENIMDILYNKLGRKLSKSEIMEMLSKGASSRKAGGVVRKKKGGTMKDLSGDGKITQKDILIGRGVIKRKHGGAIGVGKALRGYGKGYK